MKALGVIPARYASTRLPGKPLKMIGDKSMIQHVYERAMDARSLDAVIVATDDGRIVETVERFGGRAVMTSGSHPNGTSRAAEAVGGEECDVVVNIQGDEPLLPARMIDELVDELSRSADTPSATLCCRIPEEKYADPNVVKVVRDLQGFALYFSRSLIPYPRDGANHLVYEHIGIYAYRSDFLSRYCELPESPLSVAESLEQLKILEHGFRMKVIESQIEYDALSIDTEEDLEAARRIIADGVRGR